MPKQRLSSIPALGQEKRLPLIEASLAAATNSSAVFTRLYPDAALAAARHADAMHVAGVTPLSALAGLPVSIKDLLDVAGEATLAGSTVLRDATPALHDAPVVQRLRRAGAAIIGKTNMTEFAFSGVGLNPHYGTPDNPADALVARIPGGSSSGAAVSVAAGICVAAIGSDTGGSIRIPAAFCGLVGFKSTARRVPTRGAIPLSTTLDTICAMTRSVDDCVLVDSLIADTPLIVKSISLAGLRLAIPQAIVLDQMEDHVARSFAAALSRLSAAGAVILDTPLAELDEFIALSQFSGAEAYAWHRALLARSGNGYDPRVGKRIAYGAGMSAADYIHLHLARDNWIVRMEQAMAPFDALILPTVPIVAPPTAWLEASDEVYFRINNLVLRNTAWVNLLDGCAVSLPCHADGTLPVGLSVVGAAMADARILSIARVIAAALESA
ncbi:amidase [Actimicrobium antarcticum]|uniref:Amidase n=1 Tax=Actimicrobium antarcticum TaxID=1051899 RepID=A0ABP7TQG5_9BURK